MKRSISTLALAAPLAIAALSLGATPATAEPAGPSNDLAKTTELGPVNPHLPEGPEEQNPQNDPDPEPDPEPDGSDVPDDKVTTPHPCSTPDRGDEDEPEPDSGDPQPRHGDKDEPGDEDEDEPDEGDIPRPNCIDAGAAGASDGGLELAWLIAGSGLITATGAAYAVRSRASKGA